MKQNEEKAFMRDIQVARKAKQMAFAFPDACSE
jgi:hypothetical protein